MNAIINLVDKKRYSNSFKAVFYDLSLLQDNGKPWKTSRFILLILSIQLFFIIEKAPFLGFLLIPSSIIVIFPFLAALITYNSKLYIFDDKFEVRWGFVKYHSGKKTDLLEIHSLKHRYHGIYRIRIRGFSERSGFIIHYKEVPEDLKFLKIIDKNF